MKFKATFLIVFFLITYFFQAQNVEFKAKNFKDKKGYKEAVANLQKGDGIYMQQQIYMFPQALEYYLKAQDFNPNNALLNYKIGNILLNINDKGSSLPYFQKAEQLNPAVDPSISYKLAQAYHYSMDWNNAIMKYEHYLYNLSELLRAEMQPEIERKMMECKNGIEITSNPVKFELINMESINSEFNDYAPLITEDKTKMIFTSRRKGTEASQMDLFSEEYFEDLYEATADGENWKNPVLMSSILNTSSHEASAGISKDGKTLFIYKGLTNGGDIYESKLIDTAWSVPAPLSVKINTEDHESSASLSADGKTLYFTSSRPDKSIGLRDIYVTTKDEKGNWTEAHNLGPVVNTPYDEEGVFFHSDNKTLYFSSKGHNSMGGYDIFKTSLGADGNWSEPENLGYPINSPDDELHIAVISEGIDMYGLYSTQRSDGKGGKDIYRIKPIREAFLADNNNSDSLLSYQDTNNDGIPDDDTRVMVDLDNQNNNGTNNDVNNNNGNKTNGNDGQNTDNNNNQANNTSNNNNTDNNNTNNNNSDNNQANNNNNNNTDNNNLANNNNSANNSIFPGVLYKVQVGASRKPMPAYELKKRYPGGMKVIEIQHEGWYKYLIGTYNTYAEAKNIKDGCGTADAWIVTEKNGVRVHIREVMQMLSYHYFIYELLNS